MLLVDEFLAISHLADLDPLERISSDIETRRKLRIWAPHFFVLPRLALLPATDVLHCETCYEFDKSRG
jgi:hypothetical protein